MSELSPTEESLHNIARGLRGDIEQEFAGKSPPSMGQMLGYLERLVDSPEDEAGSGETSKVRYRHNDYSLRRDGGTMSLTMINNEGDQHVILTLDGDGDMYLMDDLGDKRTNLHLDEGSHCVHEYGRNSEHSGHSYYPD